MSSVWKGEERPKNEKNFNSDETTDSNGMAGYQSGPWLGNRRLLVIQKDFPQ